MLTNHSQATSNYLFSVAEISGYVRQKSLWYPFI